MASLSTLISTYVDNTVRLYPSMVDRTLSLPSYQTERIVANDLGIFVRSVVERVGHQAATAEVIETVLFDLYGAPEPAIDPDEFAVESLEEVKRREEFYALAVRTLSSLLGPIGGPPS